MCPLRRCAQAIQEGCVLLQALALLLVCRLEIIKVCNAQMCIGHSARFQVVDDLNVAVFAANRECLKPGCYAERGSDCILSCASVPHMHHNMLPSNINCIGTCTIYLRYLHPVVCVIGGWAHFPLLVPAHSKHAHESSWDL